MQLVVDAARITEGREGIGLVVFAPRAELWPGLGSCPLHTVEGINQAMNFDEIQKRWPELKRRLKERYPDLPEEDLEKTEGGRRQILMLIEAEYGAAKPKDEEDLDAILKGEDDGQAH